MNCPNCNGKLVGYVIVEYEGGWQRHSYYCESEKCTLTDCSFVIRKDSILPTLSNVRDKD